MQTKTHHLLKRLFPLFFFLLLVAASLAIQPEQEQFGWVLFGFFLFLFVIKKYHSPFLRILFLVFGAFISARYLLFRIFFTLHIEDWFSFILATLLFIAETYSIIAHLMGIFVNAAPLERPLPPLPAPDKLPSIDVFIPTYNEEEEVAISTALGCLNFDYPKHLINIYILDDGSRLPRINDPKLREMLIKRHSKLRTMAEEIGVTYLTRSDNGEAKAGMVKAAFSGRAFSRMQEDANGVFTGVDLVKTNGDLILMLDCDHIPTKDMPATVAGHFDDEKVFLVQTPHFMLNADPLRKNIGGEKRIPCESWLFYHAIQKGLDRWNASFFCGSAAFLRRKIMEEVGGLCGETITEDAETALVLHGKGYKSVYVDKPMVAGLAPESIADMLIQRARWCQGMLQILILKNPLTQKGLTLAQRISYLNCCLFWVFPIFRTIFILSPLAFLLFGANIYNASAEQVIAFSAPHFFASLMIASYIFGRLRPYPQADLLELFQMLFLFPAIIAVILSPRKPEFKTTRKGVTLDKDMPSAYAYPLFFFLAGIVAAFISGLITWFTDPFSHSALMITLLWNAFNLVFILATLGTMYERKQRRAAHRFPVAEEALLNGISGTLHNLSGSGFSLKLNEESAFTEGQRVHLQSGEFSGAICITRSDKNEISGVFEKPISQEVIGFVYGQSARWEAVKEGVLQAGGGSLSQLIYLLGASFASMFIFVKVILRALKDALVLRVKNTYKRVFLTLFCVGFLAFALPQNLHAEEIQNAKSTIGALLQEEKFIASENNSVVHIPLYIAPRYQTKNAQLTLIYDIENVANVANVGKPPKISLILNEEIIHGTTQQLTENQFALTFLIATDKLETGERVLSIHIKQETGQKTTVNFAKSSLESNYYFNDLSQNAKNLALIFDAEVKTPLPLHVVFTAMDENALRRAILATQKISLALKNRPMKISASNAPSIEKDNLIIGDAPDLFPDLTPNKRFAFISEADLETLAVPEIKNVLARGTRRSLKDFGLDTLLFRPGDSMKNTRFMIPSSTRLTPNRKLTLSFDFAYSGGFAANSRLEVFMNGKILTFLNLSNKNGAHSANYTIEVPATELQKGVNTIGLLPNLTLLPNAQNAQIAPNVTLFNSSLLVLPDTGIYVLMPELATFLTDGYPFSGIAQLFVDNPTPMKLAAVLNMAALVAQKRGSIAKSVDIQFSAWKEQNNYAYDFSVNTKLAKGSFQLEEKLLPKSDYKTALFFSGATEEDLLKGVQSLWQEEIQAKTRGRSMLLNLATNEATYEEGDAVIISDALPLPRLAFYTNNYPLTVRAIIVLMLFLFSLLAWRILKKEEEK